MKAELPDGGLEEAECKVGKGSPLPLPLLLHPTTS